MPARYINDSGHWISQAIKLRALAKTVSTATRDELLRVARDYDLMAVRAQERAQDRCRDTSSEIVDAPPSQYADRPRHS